MTKDKDLLPPKLRDCIQIARHRPCFLGFLDESEAAFCRDFLSRERTNSLLWGGYDEAQRVVAGFFPDYLEPSAEEFPLASLTFLYRKEDKLSHRDFLGAFMSLGVERSVIGDILVGEGRCVTFIKEEMSGYFRDNLRKIGRIGVKTSVGFEEPLPITREYKEIRGVVASNRLDCLIALLCHTSREKAAGLIVAGMVQVNHREAYNLSVRVSQGDILSVRGHGKFIIDEFGPLTSKGRLTLRCRKYQ